LSFFNYIIALICHYYRRTAIILQDPFENSPSDTPMIDLTLTIEINLKVVNGKELPIQEGQAS
jgi:putative membrane protein